MFGAVLVVHSIYPERLLHSIDEYGEPLHLFLFFHGYDAALKERLIDLAAQRPHVTLLPYGINRGLSRSWNEGIHLSQQYGHEQTLILNDDLHFVNDGLRKLVDFSRARSDDYGLLTVRGLEIGHSPNHGHIFQQDLACCVIGKQALATIGYFDTNFCPAYYEDIDYLYRLKLAGLPVIAPDEVLAEHERSSTSRASEKIRETFAEDFQRNRSYYLRKWGGDWENETFTSAFNDPASPPRLDFEALLTLRDG